MVIPLIKPEQVLVKRGKTKGEKYAKYAEAISPLLGWIRENIEKSLDGKIRVRIKDISKEMGPEFEKKSDTAIYWGLKYVLFQDGLVVETGSSIAREKLLIIRKGTPEDKLPPSLVRALEPPEEEMPAPGSEE